MVKKIVYFVDLFPSKSETWVQNEIFSLMQQGFEIKIFSRDKKPSVTLQDNSLFVKNTEYPKGLFLIYFFKNPIRNLSLFYKIIKAIRKDFWSDTKGTRGKIQVLKDLLLYIHKWDKINIFNPDLIVVHFADARADFALFHNLLYKTPYLIKIHAHDVFRRQNLFKLKIDRAYKILSISNYNIEFIKNRDKDIDISKFNVHHCGISINKYEFKSVPRNNNIPIILSVGRLTNMKGFDTLIKASSELHKKNLTHRIIIAGYGPDKEYLVNLSNHLKLQNVVEFKDYCSPEEVKNLLYLSDLFILASRFDKKNKTQDGIPVAIMEAMSTGLPVITTNTSGIPELIEDNVNGFLVPPDDPLKLSNKIEEIFAMSESKLNKIVINARLKIENDFNLDKLNIDLKKLFEKVPESI